MQPCINPLVSINRLLNTQLTNNQGLFFTEVLSNIKWLLKEMKTDYR